MTAAFSVVSGPYTVNGLVPSASLSSSPGLKAKICFGFPRCCCCWGTVQPWRGLHGRPSALPVKSDLLNNAGKTIATEARAITAKPRNTLEEGNSVLKETFQKRPNFSMKQSAAHTDTKVLLRLPGKTQMSKSQLKQFTGILAFYNTKDLLFV